MLKIFTEILHANAARGHFRRLGSYIICGIFTIVLTGCSATDIETINSDRGLNTSTSSNPMAFLDDERGARSISKKLKSKKSFLDRIEKGEVTTQALAPVIVAPEIEESSSENETVKAETAKAEISTAKKVNLANVEFVDDTDPKFAEVTPQVNTQTLKGVYAKIAQAALNTKKFSREALVRASEHKLEAHKQSLLPQVTPGVSLDANGDTIAQLNIEQTLYDGGRYMANQEILLSEKSSAQANLRTNENERINKAISAYIDYHNARTSQAMLSKTIKSFKTMEDQSESRINIGIGDASDRDLFQLKKLEVQSEYETQEGVALSSRLLFKALTGIPMLSQKPEKMDLIYDATHSPEVELARADRDKALGNLELQKSNKLPNIAIKGNVGTATDSLDSENMDVRLDVSLNQPLTWGFDHSSAATQSEVEASDRKYDEIFKDTQDRIKSLKFELAQAKARHKRLNKLSSNAEKRLKGFRSQFLAGQAGIAEASSTIESYKKIQINAIETEYSIYRTELELATLTGVLSQY